MEISYTMNNSWASNHTNSYNFRLQGIQEKEQDEARLKQQNANQKALEQINECMENVKEQIKRIKGDETKTEDIKELLVKELKLQLLELSKTYTAKKLEIQKQEEEERKLEEEKKAQEQKDTEDPTSPIGATKEEKLNKAIIAADASLKQGKQLNILRAQMESKAARLESYMKKDMSRGIDVEDKLVELADIEESIQNIKQTIADNNNEKTKDLNEAIKPEEVEVTEETAEGVNEETEEVAEETEAKGSSNQDEEKEASTSEDKKSAQQGELVSTAYGKKYAKEESKINVTL